MFVHGVIVQVPCGTRYQGGEGPGSRGNQVAVVEPGTDPAQQPLACHESWHSPASWVPREPDELVLGKSDPETRPEASFLQGSHEGMGQCSQQAWGVEKQKPPGLSFAKYK